MKVVMKALKSVVRSTIVIVSLAAAHSSLATPVDAAVSVDGASAGGAPKASTATAESDARGYLSEAARDRILSKSYEQGAMATKPRPWGQAGEPWVQWRGQVKKIAGDDVGPAGDVFAMFDQAHRSVV